MAKRIYPVPEIILNKKVRIESGTGSMNNQQRIMRVPLTGTARARHVRAHEMAHAKYSPQRPVAPKSIPMMAIQRAEDMRMNLYCRRQGLDEAMDAPITDEPILVQLVTVPLQGDTQRIYSPGEIVQGKLNAVTAATSGFNTGDWSPIISTIRATDPELADSISEFVPTLWDFLTDAGRPQWEDAVAVARAVTEFCTVPEQPQDESGEDESSEPGEGEPGEDESAPGDVDSEPGTGAASEPGEGSGEGESGEPDDDDSEPASSEPGEPGEGESGEGGQGGGEPGEDDSDSESDADSNSETSRTADESAEPEIVEEMAPVDLSENSKLDQLVDAALQIEADLQDAGRLDPKEMLSNANVKLTEFPLTKRLTKKMRQQSKHAADTGRVPRNIHRYASDGNIFSERGKRRITGGTILVDCSVNMGLTNESLAKLMEVAPTSTIAAYAGCWMQKAGKMHVLAQDGKRTEEARIVPSMGCACSNSADVPVLRWLAAQDGPRFWLGRDADNAQAGGYGAQLLPEQARRERDEIMKAAKITRFATIEELVRAIKSGKVKR